MPQTYTIKEAAQEIGCSVPWLRKKVKGLTQGQDYTQGEGRYSKQTVFLHAATVEGLRLTYQGGDRTRVAQVRQEIAVIVEREGVLLQEVGRLTNLLSEVQGRATSAEILAAERQEQVRQTEERLAEAQRRIEALKALGVIDRLFGRHKGI